MCCPARPSRSHGLGAIFVHEGQTVLRPANQRFDANGCVMVSVVTTGPPQLRFHLCGGNTWLVATQSILGGNPWRTA
jgi:hypothetical protein